VLGRVPPVVIDAAIANPDRMSGWGEPANANIPPSPLNPLRTLLSIRSPAVPFHPLFNPLVFKAGCP
jgi:hypothetical protein